MLAFCFVFKCYSRKIKQKYGGQVCTFGKGSIMFSGDPRLFPKINAIKYLSTVNSNLKAFKRQFNLHVFVTSNPLYYLLPFVIFQIITFGGNIGFSAESNNTCP